MVVVVLVLVSVVVVVVLVLVSVVLAAAAVVEVGGGGGIWTGCGSLLLPLLLGDSTLFLPFLLLLFPTPYFFASFPSGTTFSDSPRSQHCAQPSLSRPLRQRWMTLSRRTK